MPLVWGAVGTGAVVNAQSDTHFGRPGGFHGQVS